MKTFGILLALFCAAGLRAGAGTFDAQWIFRDAGSNVLAIKQVTIQPIAPYGVEADSLLITGDRKTYTSDAAGELTVTLFNGRSYKVEIVGPHIRTTFTNSFATDVTGTVNAADPEYLAAPIRDANVVAYSQTQSKALFHQKTGDSSTNAVFRGTFKLPDGVTPGYVWTATNADGAGAWQASGASETSLWTLSGSTLFPAGDTGTAGGWTANATAIFPE